MQGSSGNDGWPGPKGQKGETGVATQKGAVCHSFVSLQITQATNVGHKYSYAYVNA